MPFDAMHYDTNSHRIKEYGLIKMHENIFLDDITQLTNEHISITM
jgi:hypothetical protein